MAEEVFSENDINWKQDEPYTLKFSCETRKNKSPLFVTQIKLTEGNYIISPFSRDEVYGKFTIELEENEYVKLKGEISEWPETKPELDTIINDYVHFVRENTTFKKEIQIISLDDFEVKGNVWFVIEPRCTPEEIHFSLSQKDGYLKLDRIDS